MNQEEQKTHKLGRKTPTDNHDDNQGSKKLARTTPANDTFVPKFIVAGYNPATYMEERKDPSVIRGEDVVRPPNHKAWKADRPGESTEEMPLYKSVAKVPTYGSCEDCYSSGPVGKLCIFCHNGTQYKVVLHCHHIIDSVTLAQAMERGHEPARADCCFWWIRDPMFHLNSDGITRCLKKQNDYDHYMANQRKVWDMLPG
jgi:hypothetical protein